MAKLDWLGRNVAFVANLMKSRVQFKLVDNPHADELLAPVQSYALDRVRAADKTDSIGQ